MENVSYKVVFQYYLTHFPYPNTCYLQLYQNMYLNGTCIDYKLYQCILDTQLY